MASDSFPPFRPHALVRGGHAQTLAGAYLPSSRYRYQAEPRKVELADGDRLVLHDDRPSNWRPGDRAALLIHGLGGCHQSGYMQRIAHKLATRGVRAFRIDFRGCGAGAGLARLPYHSGRSEDAAAALEAIARWTDQSPTTLVGFSLGANITLKLLGELAGRPCGSLDSAMAVCPPVDLAACSRQISLRRNRFYDRYFVRCLLEQLADRGRLAPGAAAVEFAEPPRSIWQFDNTFTAVVCGFGTAENYYRESSSEPFIAHIRMPTLIVAAADDPLVPCAMFKRLAPPESVRVHITESGGHLGFVGRAGCDPDRRWIDWRVVDWVLQHAKVFESGAIAATS